MQPGMDPRAKPLTGRKVLAITVSAFAVIIAVNVYMAVKAVSTFPGLEVQSSYVASQTFDADRRAQQALGWTLRQDYRPGELKLTFLDSAGRAAPVRDISATIGRATEASDDVSPAFSYTDGAFVAPVTLTRGKWMILVQATAEDGTRYHKRLDLVVKGQG